MLCIALALLEVIGVTRLSEIISVTLVTLYTIVLKFAACVTGMPQYFNSLFTYWQRKYYITWQLLLKPQVWWTGSTWYSCRGAATVAANGGVSTLGLKVTHLFPQASSLCPYKYHVGLQCTSACWEMKFVSNPRKNVRRQETSTSCTVASYFPE